MESLKDWENSGVGINASQQVLLNRFTNRIRKSLDLQEILSTTAAEVRAFLGTDRVKIYQFQPDGHGLVVAEALVEGRLPSLLGLHFPADDIPTYASELYLRARQRTIVDLRSQQIGVIPLGTHENIDSSQGLKDIRYRPIDPCHVEYLRTMGVTSSVVVPIVIEATPQNVSTLPSLTPEDHLWGLLVSHHAEAKDFNEEELFLLQAVVDQAAVAITQSFLLDHFREQVRQESILNSLTALLYSSLKVDLQAGLESAVAVFNGSGGRLYLYQHYFEEPTIRGLSKSPELYCYGTQPDSIDPEPNRPIEDNLIWQNYLTSLSTTVSLPEIEGPKPWSVAWMRAVYALKDLSAVAPPESELWAIADLYREPLFRSLTPAFQATPIRGVLIIPLLSGCHVVGCLTIFRDNVDQELVWAGVCDPDKRQMAPRQSFEAWRQLKSGQAQEWTESDLRLGKALGERFAAAVKQYRLYNQVELLNKTLERQVSIRTAELDYATEIANQQRALADILGKLQNVSDVETIFRTATQETRQLFGVDRVSIYRFDGDWGGSFIRKYDAVTPGWAKTSLLTREVWNDDYLQERQGGRYRFNEISIVSDIYTAGLSSCHIQVLEDFNIRAYLVAPVFINSKLWGLLGVYQHTGIREWKDSEVAFVKQVTAHLGVALQQAELLAIAQSKARQVPVMEEQQQTLSGVISKIRESLDLTKIFAATTSELRRALNADRVGILRFAPDSNWTSGEFIAEDVVKGYTSAIAQKVEDHCFGERYAACYHQRQIQVITDIYALQLDPCHIAILSQFQVRANLVIPILIKDNLWGLLCIHQCSEPRKWLDWEIEFTRQIASQLEVALYQTQLLEEAKAAQRLADAANHAKSEFLANMSHELRTPLNAILGMSESLQDGIYGDISDDQYKAVTLIAESGNHLLDLITDILDLAKIEAGQLEFNISLTSLSELCETSLRFVQQLAYRKSISIKTLMPSSELVEVGIDELRTRQMLINLLNNAVKFTPNNGSIDLVVNIDRELSTIQFQVIDTGIGIAEDDLPKLFQSFVQIDSSLNRQYDGSGLGLALVKRLVTSQGGSIEVTSQIGQGSSFIVTLPYIDSSILTTSNARQSSALMEESLTSIAINDSSDRHIISEGSSNQENPSIS